MFRSARNSLVAWNVFVLAVILAILGTAVYGLFSSQVYRSADQELQDQKMRILRALVSNGGSLSALQVLALSANSPFENYRGIRTLVLDASGSYVLSTDCLYPMAIDNCPAYSNTLISKSAVSSNLASGKDDMRTVNRLPFGPQRVLTFAVDAPSGQPVAVFQISRSATSEQDELNTIRHMLIFGILGGIVLAAAGSLFLAHRALIPIRNAFARQRQFTADASHELRTPLALIRANAEMLERHAATLPPEDGELITDIIHETDHLNRLVSDLLTLARADAESAAIQSHPVDLRTLVAAVHEDLRYIAESRGIASHISLDGPVTVNGDDTRLRQLLLILLDNAIKYTDPGGSIEVSLRRDDSRARLVVADTGVGIPPNDIPHIFERFYRVDRAREHRSGGTGLGLAIAQWIVQAHHGVIRVDSEVGRGSRFLIDLPAV